jgi:GNAT superfamily N-acetyltransferase
VDYEDDEIDICGFYNEENKLIGLIRFSVENKSFLFDEEADDDDDNDNETITLIGAILVHPAYKNKGIGRKLVDYAIKNAETEWIVADPFDENAGRFFMSLDFGYDEEKIFEKDDDWCLFFQKTL